MNGHMAGVGEAPSASSFEHGVQIIDGDKEFKSVWIPDIEDMHC